MRMLIVVRRLALAVLVALALPPRPGNAQRKPSSDSAKAARREARERAAIDRAVRGDTSGLRPAPLFAADSVLHIALTADFRQLRRDLQSTPPWRPARMTWTGADGAPVDIPLQVRSRGIWRRRHCDLPPLRLRFARSRVKDTEFAGQRRTKLVVHCQDRNDYEQYVLAEYQLYRVYNALTPMSHRVRLARVSFVDSGRATPFATRYAFFLEDAEAMAERNAALLLAQQGASPGDLEPANEALVGLFEYFIGNTDFSIAALHNVELIQRSMQYYGVAHDFDFSGVVGAPYATADPRLPIRSVRDRYYRGYCLSAEQLSGALALFTARRDTIYALYRDAQGRLLAPDRVHATLDYFDEFYQVAADPRWAAREVAAGCLGR